MRDKLIVAGSRSLSPTVTQLSALISPIPSVVVCGCAPGVDRAGFRWARAHDVPVEFFPAWQFHLDWAISVVLADEVIHALPRTQSKRAGSIRNSEMARFGTRALILWDGVSNGSRNMRDCAWNARIECEFRDFTKGLVI